MRLGQSFARDLDLLASPDSGRDGDPQGPQEAADGLRPAFRSPVGADPQVASQVGAPHLESGVRSGFDADGDEAALEMTFSGDAKSGAGRRVGRHLQEISLRSVGIGGILHADLQSGAAHQVVESQEDVLGEVLLDAGGAHRPV